MREPGSLLMAVQAADATYSLTTHLSVPSAPNHLCARLIHGRSASDFERLSDDPQRKLVMVTCADGLRAISGLTGYQMLVEIGYTGEYILHKIGSEGRRVKLVIFAADSSTQPATWDNMAETVACAYPAIGDKLFGVLEALKHTPFAEIERQAGFDISEVQKNGLADQRFMTYQRLQDARGTVAEVRAFLHHTIYLCSLYAGNGYTLTEDGRRGVREYMVPNRQIAELEGARVLDLEVKIP